MSSILRSLRRPLTVLIGCGLIGSLPALPASGQVIDEAQNRELFDLRIREQRLRGDVDSNRVSRQVEVGRLEARIDELEAKLKELEHRDNGLSAFSVLNYLELLSGESPSERDGPPEEEGSSRVGAVEPTAGSKGIASDRLAFARLMADDYVLGLETALLDARIELVKAREHARSIERLRLKGLANDAQFELATLEEERVGLRVHRLEKQLAGLTTLLPAKASTAADRSAVPRADDKQHEAAATPTLPTP